MLLKIFHAPCEGSEASIGAAIRAVEEQVAAYGRPMLTSAPVVIGKTLLVSVVFAQGAIPERTVEPQRDAQRRDLEKWFIRKALRQAGHDRTAAACLLGIGVGYLNARMEKLGVTRGDDDEPDPAA